MILAEVTSIFAVISPDLPLLRTPRVTDLVLVLAMVSSILVMIPRSSPPQDSKTELTTLTLRLAPVFALSAQCFYWARYGFIMEKRDIAHFNAISAVACFCYMIVLARSKPRQQQAYPLLLAGMIFIYLHAFLISVCPVQTSTKGFLFALAAIVCSFAQLVTPVAHFTEVLRTGNAREYPWQAALWTLLANFFWACYAKLVNDQFYLFSTSLNAVVTAIVLVAVLSLALGRHPNRSDSLPLEERQPLMPRAQLLPACLAARKTDCQKMGPTSASSYSTIPQSLSCAARPCYQLNSSKSAFGAYEVDEVEWPDVCEEPEPELPEFDSAPGGPHYAALRRSMAGLGSPNEAMLRDLSCLSWDPKENRNYLLVM